jgi:ABC-2 type transport system ATP-binding protein
MPQIEYLPIVTYSHLQSLNLDKDRLAKGVFVPSIITINELSKTYDSGFKALSNVNLAINKGEIFALLGPNGAGKTTLISIICGIVNATGGTVVADNCDIIENYRQARSKIGLVPQELTTDAFESVFSTVRFSRGLFGKAPNDAYIEKILRQLSLWDKRNAKIRELSGGMKRRVMIAKALSHEPSILFLDEPTAGVDVELRRDMWAMVRELRDSGVTILLTTHYIEEAEEMADRIGVINKGRIVLVEEKAVLMSKLGQKTLVIHLQDAIDNLPASLDNYQLELAKDGWEVHYTYDMQQTENGIAGLLMELNKANLQVKDLHSSQSSLEEIFVNLVHNQKESDT